MKDEVVFVTGGAMGMGEAVALLAAEKGAKVVVTDVDEKAVQAVADKIRAKGREALALRCNVTVADDVKTAINRTVQEYGRLDAAFNNAGIMLPMVDTAEMPEEDFDKVINIT